MFSSFKIKTLIFYTTITQHNIIWSWSVKFEKQTTNYDFRIGSLYFLRSNFSRENEISYGKMRPVFINRSFSISFVCFSMWYSKRRCTIDAGMKEKCRYSGRSGREQGRASRRNFSKWQPTLRLQESDTKHTTKGTLSTTVLLFY